MAFCLCPENFPGANTLSNVLICLAKEFSKQLDVESVAWMSLITVMQAYGGKKTDWAKRSTKYSVKKKSSRKLNVTAKTYARKEADSNC